MESFSDIIDALGGPTAAMQALGAPSPQAVWNMKARNSIPARYWPRLVAAMAERGIVGVTHEGLARLASRRGGPERDRGALAAAMPASASEAAE